MNEILVFVLLALNVVQYLLNNKERRDLLNSIMSKDGYIVSKPPKGRSFLKLGGGEGR